MSPSPPLLPLDEEILNYCRLNRKAGERTLKYISQGVVVAFIKIGSLNSGILCEINNHMYAYKALEAQAQQKRAAIRIPQIYRVLEETHTRYIVMEYVEGKTLEELLDEEVSCHKYFRQISKAVKLLLSFEIPADASPEPIGGGLIKHDLFKDGLASIKYRLVSDLQEHVQNVANLPETNNLKINFQNGPICFCYSDLFEGNFIFTDKTELYIVDFEHAGILPTSFNALDQPRPVCLAIKEDFPALPSQNL